jgi:predicted DNA-binding transcriptional regulator YafY
MSWGSGAEVLAPTELRTDIHQEIQKVLQAYD